MNRRAKKKARFRRQAKALNMKLSQWRRPYNWGAKARRKHFLAHPDACRITHYDWITGDEVFICAWKRTGI